MTTKLDELAVVLCTSQAQLAEAYRIRIEVFADEQGFAADEEVDEYDLHSAHFLLYRKDDAAQRGLGTIRFSAYPSEGSLNKITLPEDKPLGDARSEAGISQLFVDAYEKASSKHKPEMGELQAGAKLGRLAVDKVLRGTGAGRLLVEEAERWLHQVLQAASPVHSDKTQPQTYAIRLHSQMPVRGFYERMGYGPIGDVFDEDGAPHMLYVKRKHL